MTGIFSVKRLFYTVVKIGSLLRISPYYVDKSTDEIGFRSSWLQKLYSEMWFLLMISYASFLVWQSREVYIGNADASAKVGIFYMAGMHCILVVGHHLARKQYGRHHVLLNAMFDFTTRFKAKFGMDVQEKPLIRTMSVAILLNFFAISNAIAVFLSPESPRLLTSLFAHPRKLPRWIKLLLFVFHLGLNWCIFYVLFASFVSLYTYVFLVTPVIHRLRWCEPKPLGIHGRQVEKWLVSPTSTPPRCGLSPDTIRVYSIRLLILQAEFTKVFGSWILLLTLWAIFAATLRFFQAVVFENARAAVTTLAICALLATLSKHCGESKEASMEVHESWKMVRYPSWFSKHARSWKGAYVPLGSFFFFDKGIILTFMHIILTGAVNLIVSHR